MELAQVCGRRMRSWLPVLLLAHVSQHASGVEVYEGEESVLLPCKVAVNVSSSATAVVWDRDEFKIPTVHMRLQSGDHLNDQNRRYRNRTSMRADALQTGDLSLTLREPTLSDSGTYTCIPRKFGQDQSRIDVELKVKERSPSWPWVLCVTLLLLVLLSALGVFMFYRYKWINHTADCQELMVDASQGDKAVLLPFKTTEDFPHNVTVQWELTEPKCMLVHVYQRSQSQPEQDQVYQGRTEMNEDPLRNKDLSLKLKDLRLTDNGVYTCTIRSKNGNVLLRKVVSLTVRESQMEMVEMSEWEESVLLPFKTKADLSQDVTVEWKCSDLRHANVFRFQSNQHLVDEQDQVYRGRTEMNEERLTTGDLSLKLKQPRITDSGIYTCTVCNNEGDILKKKVVVLKVKVYQFQMLEVTQGEKHVLLPFITTADQLEDVTVEWKRSDFKHMKVHVYPKSQNMPDDEQDQNYQGRTEMNEEPLRTGDLSLKLQYPRITDSGVYTCTAFNKDGDIVRYKVVILSVTVYQVEMVKVTQGDKSVLLPFKTTADFPDDVSVEWRRADSKDVVHMHQNGQNQLAEQSHDYKGRTEMSKEPLRTGDLSLKLRRPRLTDSGVYTCTIYSKDGDIVRRKVVMLSVRVYQVEMVEVTKGKKSVVLLFKTTAGLPEDATVEWRRADTKDVVHMYHNGQNQPAEQGQDYRGRTEMNEDPLRTGDLSLTLKNPQHNHSGFYTCTVSKGEDILRQKRLTLSVKERRSASFAERLQVFRKKRTPVTNGLPPPESHEADLLMAEQSM